MKISKTLIAGLGGLQGVLDQSQPCTKRTLATSCRRL